MTKRRTLMAAFKKKVALIALRGDKILQDISGLALIKWKALYAVYAVFISNFNGLMFPRYE